MLAFEEIEAVLLKIIGNKNSASELARLLHDLVKQAEKADNFVPPISIQQSLIPLINSLNGREVRLSSKVIEFGSENQMGDITIKDLAQGNINKYTINTYINASNEYLSLNSPRILPVSLHFDHTIPDLFELTVSMSAARQQGFLFYEGKCPKCQKISRQRVTGNQENYLSCPSCYYRVKQFINPLVRYTEGDRGYISYLSISRGSSLYPCTLTTKWKFVKILEIPCQVRAYYLKEQEIVVFADLYQLFGDRIEKILLEPQVLIVDSEYFSSHLTFECNFRKARSQLGEGPYMSIITAIWRTEGLGENEGHLLCQETRIINPHS